MADAIQVSELGRSDGCTVAQVTGPLDYAGGPAFRTTTQPLLDQASRRLVLDLSGVNFCDSSGLNELLILHRRATDVGISLALARIPPLLQQILIMTGADRFSRCLPRPSTLLTHPARPDSRTGQTPIRSSAPRTGSVSATTRTRAGRRCRAG